MKKKPQTLYRAYRISPNDLEERIFSQTHVPKNASSEDPTKTIDGNELGVYMSTNQIMVESTDYANSGKGSRIQTKKYDSGRELQDYFELPGLGIVLKICTEGLEIREPKISDVLGGHYNNGFQGKEWITDELPPTNYYPIKFILSRYTNDSKRFVVEVDGRNKDGLTEAIRELKQHYDDVVSDSHQKANEINSLPEKKRRNTMIIYNILQN